MNIRRCWGWVRGAVMAVCIGLIGCRADSGLPTDASFIASEPWAAADGMLLVGMRLVRPITRSALFYDYTPGAFFRMTLRGLDASNQLTPVSRTIQVCDLIAPELGALSTCDPTLMTYRMIRLPAGRYVLHDFVVHEHKSWMTTNYVGGKTISPLAGRSGRGPMMPPQLVVIDIAPREITYVGEFNWDAQPFPAKFIMTRDDLGARIALSTYPGIDAPLVFRPVVTLPVPSYPSPD